MGICGVSCWFSGVYNISNEPIRAENGFGTKTRLECPDIHGRYIPAMLEGTNETNSHRQK